MIKTILFYFQFLVLLFIVPFIVVYRELANMEFMYHLKDAYIDLFKYKKLFEKHKKEK